MKPELPRQTKTYEQYLGSDQWCMQQKMDGQRLLCQPSAGIWIGRDGQKACGRNALHGLRSELSGFWFDGEMSQNEMTYYVFDIFDPSWSDADYLSRFNFLQGRLIKYPQPNMVVVPAILSNKREKFDELKANGCEGVVFKRLTSKHRDGKSRDWLKYKFTNDVDCVVMEVGTVKANLTLGMYADGVLKEVGKISSLTGDGPRLQVGDVCKVNCLYVGKDGRLYQPVKPIFRNDKQPLECTIDQLDNLKANRSLI